MINIYGTIIILTLVITYVLNILADCLNLKTLSGTLPEEMLSVYDPDIYRKAQDYTRVTTRFGFITSTFMLALTFIFWFSGGFNILDQVVRRWGLSFLLSGLAYIGLLLFFKGLVSIPFALYHTFVIEADFGFNKITPILFFLDLAKGVFLSILLGGPLLAALIAFFEYAGPYTWLYAWGATTLFLLLVQFMAPTWIMPLFNQFKPLEPEALKEKLMSLALSLHFPLQNIFVIDGSRRSSKSNAFFTGFGKNRRIALYDTLIASHTTDELLAILAHEIGHYKKKHTLQGLALGILQAGGMFFLLSVFMSHNGLYQAFLLLEPSVYTGLVFFSMLYAPIGLILSLFLNMLSRKNEYEADRFAVESIAHPENMIEALKKLAKNNLSNLRPHPFYSFLNDSHPPLLERIRAIRAVLANQSSSGTGR